jgi:hypothetical protein
MSRNGLTEVMDFRRKRDCVKYRKKNRAYKDDFPGAYVERLREMFSSPMTDA